jgi:hypothetical protein
MKEISNWAHHPHKWVQDYTNEHKMGNVARRWSLFLLCISQLWNANLKKGHSLW